MNKQLLQTDLSRYKPVKVTDNISINILSCHLPAWIIKLLQRFSHSDIFSLIAESYGSCCDVSFGIVNNSTYRNVPPPLTTDLSKLFDLQPKLAHSLNNQECGAVDKTFILREIGMKVLSMISGADITLCEFVGNHTGRLTYSLSALCCFLGVNLPSHRALCRWRAVCVLHG